jgi:maltose-binding protein MalE
MSDAYPDAFAEAEEEAAPGPQLPGFEELWAAQERAAELTETGTDAEYEAAVAERQQTEAAFLHNIDRQLDAALEAEAG